MRIIVLFSTYKNLDLEISKITFNIFDWIHLARHVFWWLFVTDVSVIKLVSCLYLLSVCLSVYLPIYLLTYLPIYPLTRALDREATVTGVY
jgi:hypothetical protein